MAIQGVYEVEACHLQAVQHGGPDEITNAMAMCRHHHWAYDRGLFALSGAGRILIGKNMEAAMIEEFRGQQQATFPTDVQLWPRADRLAAHRTQFGFA
ncbi:HNH endonuclease [Devosia sp. PTR5]|uniref:HNH endonuclease n=1 Tax=Devosia oryzisoli TaxID=2774138 RepID=A0A927FXG2_9HYPH|nr:HNH endonuclease [Devosia oryzisoli]MBD8067342.1 HNH endonuclease [Devosia oryzisoli]